MPYYVPLEMLYAIVNELKSEPALFQLRLVSKTLNSVATPLAFRILIVKDSVRSAEGLSSLQRCEGSITSAVREVIFQGDHDSGSHVSGHGPWINKKDTSGKAGRKALKTAFSRLANFPNLDHIHFNFHNRYQEDSYNFWPRGEIGDIPADPTHFWRLQFDLFAALAASPPPSVVSLTLDHVLACPNHIYTEDDFLNIFRRLKTLRISALSDLDCTMAHDQRPLIQFWDSIVPGMIRSGDALTSLTLRSDQLVEGTFLQVLAAEDTFIPHLSSLTLDHFAFYPPLPPEVVFILAHKATLTHLELRRCAINDDDGEFSCPWHTILAIFEAELSSLQTFEMSEGSDGRFVYTVFDIDPGYMVQEEVPSAERDLAALESLMTAVSARRSGSLHDESAGVEP
ncbi:hypothetical protein DFH09DRAFT_1376456, partial [Mycena vulgaris]